MYVSLVLRGQVSALQNQEDGAHVPLGSVLSLVPSFLVPLPLEETTSFLAKDVLVASLDYVVGTRWSR